MMTTTTMLAPPFTLSLALARLATWCAGLKFTVLLAAVGSLLTVGTATLIQRLLPH